MSSIDSKMALDIAFILPIFNVPVSTFQIIFKANPLDFNIGYSGTKIRYNLLSSARTAIGNFLDDTVLAVPEMLRHGG